MVLGSVAHEDSFSKILADNFLIDNAWLAGSGYTLAEQIHAHTQDCSEFSSAIAYKKEMKEPRNVLPYAANIQGTSPADS